MRGRLRHPGHPDEAFAAEPEVGLHDGRWRPLAAADVSIALDTTDWDEDAVAATTRRCLEAVRAGSRGAGTPTA